MDDLRRVMKKELGPERVELMHNVLAHTRLLSVGEQSVGEQYASDIRDLARVLGVTTLHRIEGYDISNIMGRDAVGSMVVFLDGEPAKSEYKKFKIKTVQGANDVAMLEEVLTRRIKHSLQNSKSQIRNSFWPLPDLMIIDGGKAQRNAALRVLKNACLQNVAIATKYTSKIEKQFQRIFVIAIAKGGHGGVLRQKEEIYFPGERMPLKLSNASSVLHLVLRVRDEAHRFAIGYHKILRKKKFFA